MITTSSFKLIVAIRFLYQTDANILHGQEGKAMNISCATIAGHKTDKLSIKHQGITLSNSTSNIVTFNFIPDRHDNLKEYVCVTELEATVIRAKLQVYCKHRFY